MLTTITAAPLMAPPQTAAEPSRKVVVLLASPETQAALWGWATAAGFDLGASFGGEPRDPRDFEFHLTLFATVGPSALPEQEHASYDALAYVFADGFDALGPDADTPVLTIEDTDGDLASLRAEWLAAADAEPTYPDFKPHVSLSYAWGGTPALADLDPPPFVLVFDRLEVRTLDAPVPAVGQIKSGSPAIDEASANIERALVEMERRQEALDEAQAAVAKTEALLESYIAEDSDASAIERVRRDLGAAELAADLAFELLEQAERSYYEWLGYRVTLRAYEARHGEGSALLQADIPAKSTKSADDLRLNETIRAALAGIPAAAPLLDEHDLMVEALRRLQSGPLDVADMDTVTAITNRLDQIEADLAALL